MADKDDFDFWEPQDSEEEQLASDTAVDQELRQHLNESEAAKPGARRQLFLLLALLLVLVGAAAYFFLGEPPAPEAPLPATTVRQPIALPPPPVSSEEALVKTEQMPPPPAAVGEPAAPAAEPALPVEVAAPAGQAAPAPPPATAAPAPASDAPAKAGAYSLQAGAFLVKSNLRAAEATVRRLGYEPRVKVVRRTLPMVRLRVGGFFAEEGEAKLKSLKTVAPDAFLIRQGDFVLVYAGSYQDLDRARRAADHLYQQGIRVEEEPTTAEVPLSLLSFGDFADRRAAEQAAVKAQAAGLEAVVRKDH
jgi:hypothetical protein